MSYEYPAINGTYHSWADIRISLEVYGGPSFGGGDITAIDFDDSLDPTKVFGTGPFHRGMTVGQYDANASMTMLLTKGTEFQSALKAAGNGRGVFLVPFDITVQWSPPDEDAALIQTVKVLGCRLKGRGYKNAPGGDGTVIEMPLAINMIVPVDAQGNELHAL